MAEPSRWPWITDALVDKMRARAGYRAPLAEGTTGLETIVFEGPEYGVTEQPVNQFLVIGWGGDPTVVEDIGLSGQSIATLGNRMRDEDASIQCLAVAQSGNRPLADLGTVRATKHAAFNVVGDVQDLLINDPTLGIAAPRLLIQFGQIQAIRLFASDGANAWIAFTVTYNTRI